MTETAQTAADAIRQQAVQFARDVGHELSTTGETQKARGVDAIRQFARALLVRKRASAKPAATDPPMNSAGWERARSAAELMSSLTSGWTGCPTGRDRPRRLADRPFDRRRLALQFERRAVDRGTGRAPGNLPFGRRLSLRAISLVVIVLAVPVHRHDDLTADRGVPNSGFFDSPENKGDS